MKICAIVGHSKSGKTRLIRQLIPELKKRGHSVAVIKHCAGGFVFDMKGKDSWQFMEAGSNGVAMISPDQLAVLKRKMDKVDFYAVAAEYFRDVDIILVEGGQRERGLKKIEVLRRGVAEKVECLPEELIAVVSDVKVAVNKPVYHPDQIGEIADIIEGCFEHREPRIVLDIDGTSVLLNAFVQKIIENIVLGIVTSLEGVKDNPQRITLSVIRKEREDDKL
ncbi:MAG TPA: molybdopterin-guanine dinucleotide biosynthesis protein B [Candidatus Aminicenantes bacterium]|nr:molybdopterin-guanine dinucleotide biosynthesis protein B [Candidatus Aminicenantes bacterium]